MLIRRTAIHATHRDRRRRLRSYDADLHADRRALADPLGTDHLAITRYVLEPGERFSGSVHAHIDQEEVFLVLEDAE